MSMVPLPTHQCLQSERQSLSRATSKLLSNTKKAKLSFLTARRKGQDQAGLVLQEEKDGVANTHDKSLLWLLGAVTAAASQYLGEFFLMNSCSTDPVAAYDHLHSRVPLIPAA